MSPRTYNPQLVSVVFEGRTLSTIPAERITFGSSDKFDELELGAPPKRVPERVRAKRKAIPAKPICAKCKVGNLEWGACNLCEQAGVPCGNPDCTTCHPMTGLNTLNAYLEGT